MAAAPDRTFVHADFSPKNILVHRRGLTLVDFETAHAGDPAFDLGFFLSHLCSRRSARASTRRQYLGLVEPFWDGYHAEAGPGHPDLSARSTRHAAACMLARVDGKSPSITSTTRPASRARSVAREILAAAARSGSTTWHEKCRRNHRRRERHSRRPILR